MSVLVIGKFPGDTDKFRQALADRASIQDFITSVGAAPVPPEITVGEAISSPDQY